LLAEIGSNRPEALEEIRLISEPLDPELEQRLAAQWNVRCANIYSANEVGYIAFQCAERDGLHVQSESVFVEILDAKGQPCANGETGRVVVTPLHNLAMPLIRYEIGDFATVGASCACGRALPIIQDVRGRVRNMVRTPDGRRFWPTSMNGIRKIPPVRQAQFVQPTVDRIEVRVVLDRPLTAAEAEQAIAFVRTTFGYPFDVSLAVVEAIERGPTGKFEEFLSLLPDERT
jgi:phenylacetate-CoA ligase